MLRRRTRRARLRFPRTAATWHGSSIGWISAYAALTGGGGEKSRKLRLRSTLSSLTRRPCEKPCGLTACTNSTADARLVAARMNASSCRRAICARRAAVALDAVRRRRTGSAGPASADRRASATSIASASPSTPRCPAARATRPRARVRAAPRGIFARLGVALREMRDGVIADFVDQRRRSSGIARSASAAR